LNRCGSDSFRASSHRYNPIVPIAAARKIETDTIRIKDPPVSDLDPDDLADRQHPEDLHDHGDGAIILPVLSNQSGFMYFGLKIPMRTAIPIGRNARMIALTRPGR